MATSPAIKPGTKLPRAPQASETRKDAPMPGAGAHYTKQRLAHFLAVAALTTVMVEICVLFRLWSQLTASVPAGQPGRWLYDLGGLLAMPFRPFDTTQPVNEAPILDFATLLAFQCYLVAGLALGALAFLISRRRHLPSGPKSRVKSVATAGAGQPVLPAVQKAFMGSPGAVAALARSIACYVKTRDWEGCRTKAAHAYTSSNAQAERVTNGAARWARTDLQRGLALAQQGREQAQLAGRDAFENRIKPSIDGARRRTETELMAMSQRWQASAASWRSAMQQRAQRRRDDELSEARMSRREFLRGSWRIPEA